MVPKINTDERSGGPGGCQTPEACLTYCKEHADDEACKKFFPREIQGIFREQMMEDEARAREMQKERQERMMEEQKRQESERRGLFMPLPPSAPPSESGASPFSLFFKLLGL